MAAPILDCGKSAYTGQNVLVDIAFACGDVPDPKGLSYLPIGAMRTKSLSMTQDTADATADDTVGFFREMIGTYKGFTFSGDGVSRAKDGSRSNLTMLTKYFAGNQQANLWLRVTYPDVTFFVYVMVTDLSREAPNDDVATYSLEVQATASEHGVLLEDTPDTTVVITGLTVTPPSLVIADVGDVAAITAAVLPPEANQFVIFTSSDETIVTVSTSGLVTRKGEGTATITARPANDMTKSETVEVTAI